MTQVARDPASARDHAAAGAKGNGSGPEGVTAKKKVRGRPFPKGESGNKNGRPEGSRNAATLAAQVLLDGEAQALTRKAVELALAGDHFALKLCLERILPPARERTFKFALPRLRDLEDAPKVIAALLKAVSKGELTLGEAGELAKLVEAFERSIVAEERLKNENLRLGLA